MEWSYFLWERVWSPKAYIFWCGFFCYLFCSIVVLLSWSIGSHPLLYPFVGGINCPGKIIIHQCCCHFNIWWFTISKTGIFVFPCMDIMCIIYAYMLWCSYNLYLFADSGIPENSLCCSIFLGKSPLVTKCVEPAVIYSFCCFLIRTLYQGIWHLVHWSHFGPLLCAILNCYSH